MLKNLTIKKQLYLMVILPIFGFLYLAGSNAYDKYKQLQEIEYLESLAYLSKNANDLAHSMENERGYSMCFTKTERKNYKKEREDQISTTDRKIKIYNQSLEQVDKNSNTQLLNSKFEEINKSIKDLSNFRASIYNLEVSPREISEYYTPIIKSLISITEQISMISHNSEISKLASINLSLQKAKNEASLERTIINSVLLTNDFDPISYNNFSYAYTSQEASVEYFKSFASNKQRDMFESKMAHGSVLETNRIRKLAFEEIQKAKIVSQIKSALGYGGIIHSFKNYILRADKKYYNRFYLNYNELQSLIHDYHKLSIQSHEKKYLSIIQSTIDEYKNNIDKVITYHKKGINPKAIDKMVLVNDAKALNAIYLLTKKSIGVTSSEWCFVSTDRINILNEIIKSISSDLYNYIILKKSEVQDSLTMFLILMVILALVTIYTLYKIIEKMDRSLNSLEEGLNSFFDYLNYKDKRPMEIKAHGNDEISSMSRTINENIYLVEAGLRCDKNVMKEVSDAVEAIRDDIFKADEVLCFADNPMLEDLKDDFNEMLKVLRDRTKELAEYKENLEQIIIMKTNELEKLNKNLESKVEEKTSELQEAFEIVEKEKNRLANFSDFLTSLNSVDVGFLCNKAMKHLMDVSNALIGMFYLKDENDLKLISSYSLDQNSLAANTFNIDSLGIIPLALERDDWMEIRGIDEKSLIPIDLGLAKIKFTNFYAIPLKFQNKKLGVIVLAGSERIDKDYLNSYIKALVSSLNNAVSYNLIQKQSLNLEQANLELKRADKLKSEFLANMSHELRTPLNSIIGFSSILQKNKKGNLEAKQLTQVEKINTNGNHLLSLINDILDLSKIEAGKIELDMRDIDLLSLVDTTVGMLQGQAHNKSITLEFENSTEEEKVVVNTDDNKLRQVIVNVIGNAIKFVDPGSGKVVVESKLDNGYLDIAVRDNGIGIPEDKLNMIFEAFRQADGSTTRKYGGTGLGLTISKNIVELLGGTIKVESTLGEGSTFTIKVPVGEHNKKVVVDKSDNRILLPKDKKDMKSVLIIDDTKDSREIIEEYIKDLPDLDIYTAQDGEEGIKVARDVRPSLIITDIMMPGMSGWEVLEALQKDNELKNIPVIIVSNVSNESKAYSLGATDCLNKPISKNDLMTVFKKNFKSQHSSVLVVDDEPDVRDLMVDILADDVKSIKLAKNGAEAYTVLDSGFYPDMIFLDLMMPEIDGFKFLEMVKSNPKYKSIPIIIISAKDLTKEDMDILQKRNVQVIKKGKDLENAVKQALV
jgi:signal transduction histidine kinase/CheY-like chemotaxis protein/CHASE3 domain sensor protein